MILFNFNSIKVQLELSGSQASYYSQMSFQFHKGTIRTSWLEREDEILDYFNSIKVQLELIEYGKVAAHVNYFNSIKVQLERRSSALLLSSTEFQFHKGTIRTR